MGKTLSKFLLETKAELLIRKQEIATKMFKKEVAVNNIIFAIDEALNQIEKDKE